MDPREGNEGVNGNANSSTPLLETSTRPRASSLATKLGALLQDWWLWEIVSATTCILALSVIIIILALYDSSSLPDWPSVFTVRRPNPFFVSTEWS